MEKARILIVEDERIIAMHLESSLLNIGHSVTKIVASGEEAIVAVEETHPDLVLMDIRLQGAMNGIEAANQIHNLYKLPVVYLTAYSDEETIQGAKVSDPFGYILKPFEKRELQVVIELSLYKHQAERYMERAYEELEQRVEERTRELVLLEKQKELILNSAGEGIFGLDHNGRFHFINLQAARLLGVEKEGVIGKYAQDYLRGDILQVLRDGKTRQQDDELFFRKDGVPVPVEYTATPIREDENSKTLGCVVVFRDISSRKKAEWELEKLALDLKISNKELNQCLQAVFSGLTGPIKTIINYGNLLGKEYGKNFEAEGKSIIHSIIEDGKKLKSFLSMFLVYYNLDRDKYKMETVETQTVVDDILHNWRGTLEKNRTFVTVQNLPPVRGNRFLLGLLFRNLLSHTLHSPGERPLQLSLYTTTDNQNGLYTICLEASGWKLNKGEEEEMFHLFWSQRNGAREEYHGPALALCRKIVEFHGGKIWARAVGEQGTRITFHLPIPLREFVP